MSASGSTRDSCIGFYDRNLRFLFHPLERWLWTNRLL
jgi:hypothetical protein